ncbi:MAG: hypothetical protein HYU77_18165 [Betaproteobacteria bacterium]|nr:hypothetical protein [Betaproteobacteria bacterium]
MAIVHTNLQNTAQFQTLLDSAEAASANLGTAVNQGGSAFSELNNGISSYFVRTDTVISGQISGGGIFQIQGSNLLSSPATVTYIRYDDNSPVATLQVFGNIVITETSETGTITRMNYDSAATDFDIVGSFDFQTLEAGLLTYSISSVSVDLTGSTNVHVSFQGAITSDNGVISGTVTTASLNVNGQYIQVANLNHAASILDGNDAGLMMSSLLNGDDMIYGDDLDQSLSGFDGNDTFIGGAGNDEFRGMAGDDELYGGAGNDTLRGAGGNDDARGQAGDDVLYGGAGNDTLRGAGGNDINRGAGGDDVLYGGAFNDTLFGGAGNDVLRGAGGNDSIQGGFGDDLIYGGAGNDVLSGDGGNDTLTGGLGADRFMFTAALDPVGNVDTLLDFEVGVDKFLLDPAVFTALSAGALATESFRAGTTAADADDRILYDSATGSVFYDADGSGTGADPVLFAQVTSGLALTAADFLAGV